MNFGLRREAGAKPFHRACRPGKLSACRLAVIVVFTLCAVACSLPGKSQTSARQTYRLQGDGSWDAPAADATRHCLSLRVTTPVSAPGFGTARMAYSTRAPRLDYFAYHEWVDTPARMIAAMMETRLDASGLFGAVLMGSSDVRTDLRLDSELRSLQQNIDGNDSAVELVVKVSLVDVSSRSLLGTRTFHYKQTADGANAEAGVAAANRAADEFLTDLTGFVSGSIARFRCPAGNAPQGSIGPSGE